LARVVNLEIV